MFGSVSCYGKERGWGGLLAGCLCKGVKDCVRKYGLVVVEIVVCGKLSMDVKPFNCVHVCSFFMAVQYLHDTVHGTEKVSVFIKVFRETGCVAVVSEGCLVLLVSRCEVSMSLSDVCLIAVGIG